MGLGITVSLTMVQFSFAKTTLSTHPAAKYSSYSNLKSYAIPVVTITPKTHEHLAGAASAATITAKGHKTKKHKATHAAKMKHHASRSPEAKSKMPVSKVQPTPYPNPKRN